MRRVASTAGFTLVELLMAATLMILVLGTVLTTLERFVANNRRNQQLTQDVERGRELSELLARDARNGSAYQTSANTSASAVLRASAQDFVFKTVAANATSTATNTYGIQSVRYCVAAAPQRVIRQVHADAVLPSATCPDATWTSTDAVVDVVNGSRPVFTYDSATTSLVSRVAFDIFIDSTPGKAPVETPLHSGVFLRNANRPPVAAFNTATGPSRHVMLNGSASVDPDGGVLSYSWTDNGTTLTQTGPVVDYVPATSGTHTFTLTVTDRGGLSDTTTPVQVVVQA